MYHLPLFLLGIQLPRRLLISGGLLSNLGNVQDNYKTPELYFYGDVDPDTSIALQASIKVKNEQLEEFVENESGLKNPHIDLHIQSRGGSAMTGLHLSDYIIKSKFPIHTYVDGFAASAATIMSVSGTKRFITKHSLVLIHQPSVEISGSQNIKSLEDEETNMKMIFENMINIYATYTKMDRKKISELLEDEKYLNSNDCLKLGIVDYIL